MARCELPSVCILKLPHNHLAIMASRHHCALVAQQVDGGDAVGRGGAPPEDDGDHQVGGACHLNPAPLCNQNESNLCRVLLHKTVIDRLHINATVDRHISKKVQK